MDGKRSHDRARRHLCLVRICSQSLIFLILIVLFLLFTPKFAHAHPIDDPFGPQSLGDIPISTLYHDQLLPRTSYASQAGEYLVVWENTANASDHDLYGQEVAANGDLIGTGQGLVYDNFDQTNPDIVYNNTDQEYLLVWEQTYSATDHDIYSCRLYVSPGSCTPSIVAYTNAYESSPAVAYNPDQHEYLVVYERKIGGDEFAYHELFAQRVSALGATVGSALTLVSNGLDQSSPAVVYGGGTYLITWQGKQPGSADVNIYAQLLAGDSATPGGIIPVSTWEGDQVRPRLVYNHTDSQFMIVWEDQHWTAPTGWSIYGQRVDLGGNLVNTQIAIATSGEQNRLNPEVIYNQQTRGYLVTWELQYNQLGDEDIYARRVAYDGTLPAPAQVVIATGNAEQHPAIASGSTNSSLVVWEDARNSGTTGLDVYGSMWPVILPTFSGHVYSGNSGDTSTPIPGATLGLYCSSGSTDLGSLTASAVTDGSGAYLLPSYVRCEYYNIAETDPAGYYSTGYPTTGGIIKDNNWVYYTDPLDGKNLTSNNFWDAPLGPTDTLPPGWANFSPASWINTRDVNFSVQAQDGFSGLAVASAGFSISQNHGDTWTEWDPASCTGRNGTKATQTVSASAGFSQDSGPLGPDMVRFRIRDVAGNMGQSPAYPLKIDTISPLKPNSVNCSTHPTSMWKASNLVSCLWAGASDTLSGVAGYTIAWDHTATTLPGLSGGMSDDSFTNTPLPDGEWYLNVRTLDAAGNGSIDASYYGPIRIDTVAPDAWITYPLAGDINVSEISVNWTGLDGLSGLAGYDVQASTDGSAFADWKTGTKNTGGTYHAARGQLVSFRVRAHDVAGNVGAWSTPVPVSVGVLVNVRVVDEYGAALPGADVYVNGKIQGTTFGNGERLLGNVLLGDQLSARYQVAAADAAKPVHSMTSGGSWSYRTYITSIDFDSNGFALIPPIVNTGNTNVLVVKKHNTLIGVYLLVSVEWDASEAFLMDLLAGLKNASDYLFDVTDGQMFFQVIDIRDNKEYWDAADVQINASNNLWANANVGGMWKGTDKHMHLSRFESYGQPFDFNTWNIPDAFRTATHEFGHYGLGLFDEYLNRSGGGDGAGCTLDHNPNPTAAEDAIQATFMDNQRYTTEMCSTLGVHPHNTNTEQDAKNGGPGWKTFFERFSDTQNPQRWIIERPEDRGSIMAGPTAIPVPDWTVPRVINNSSNACAPFMTHWNNVDGTAALKGLIWVASPGAADLDEGETRSDTGDPDTATTGIITILGAHNGDTVHFNKDCGWLCSQSGQFVVSCSPQANAGSESVEASSVDNPFQVSLDPFYVNVTSKPVNESSVEVTVQSSAALTEPPQVEVWQDGAPGPVPVSLTYDGITYYGVAELALGLETSGKISVTAKDTHAQSLYLLQGFAIQPIQAGEMTTVRSPDGQAEVVLPADGVPAGTVVSIQLAGKVSPTQGKLVLVGNSYTISKSSYGNDLSGLAALNIYFPADDAQSIIPDTLQIYRWDLSKLEWVPLGGMIDLSHDMLSTMVGQFGTYAILGQPGSRIDLPLIRK
jgi:hypothetical protein